MEYIMGTSSTLDLTARLEELWREHKPLTLSRLSAVESALQAREAGDLSSDLCSEAALESHKLAGSLGTFGLQEGTEAARAIEVWLDSYASGNPRSVREFRNNYDVLASAVMSRG
jgi:HPt (histidine-containing phosphotransfer) domain-containing protein